MKYRDILGFSKKPKKKKVVKEQPKPKVNKVLDSVKKEFGYSKEKSVINEKVGDLYEGPSYEYAPYIKKIDKAEKELEKAVEKFELFLARKKKLKREAGVINSIYVGYVGKFTKAFEKLVRGLL
jgi:hypothetical protein|tara:strand:+ start:151 stop:522 length:372 start_codon:yes stop_codon:yes gene_type:complete